MVRSHKPKRLKCSLIFDGCGLRQKGVIEQGFSQSGLPFHNHQLKELRTNLLAITFSNCFH